MALTVHGSDYSEAYKSLYGKVRRSPLNIALNIVIVFFCAILVFELSFNLLFTGIYVIDRSMFPTIVGAERQGVPGGEFIYVDKYATPTYDDIVVVYWERVNGSGETVKGNIIKRAVAFGGDTVELKEGRLFVNGVERAQDYLDPDNNTPGYGINNYEKHVVKEGYMFLLGDNRNVSNDSRQNGDFPVSDLVGVVPGWAMSLKSVTTAIYTFFNFTVKGH